MSSDPAFPRSGVLARSVGGALDEYLSRKIVIPGHSWFAQLLILKWVEKEGFVLQVFFSPKELFLHFAVS